MLFSKNLPTSHSRALDLALKEIVQKPLGKPDVVKHIADPDLHRIRDNKVVHFGHRFQDPSIHLSVELEHLGIDRLPWIIFFDALFPRLGEGIERVLHRLICGGCGNQYRSRIGGLGGDIPVAGTTRQPEEDDQEKTWERRIICSVVLPGIVMVMRVASVSLPHWLETEPTVSKLPVITK